MGVSHSPRWSLALALLLGGSYGLVLAQELPTTTIAQYEADNFEQALPLLASAYRANPDDPDLRRRLALTHFALLNYREALPLLEASLVDQPQDIQLLRSLTEVQLELRLLPAALAGAERAVALQPDAESYALLGRVKLASGDELGAEAAFEQALLGSDDALHQRTAVALIPLYLANQQTSRALDVGRTAIARDGKSAAAETLRRQLQGLDLIATPADRRLLSGVLGYRFEIDDNVTTAPDGDVSALVSAEDDLRHVLFGDVLLQRSLGNGFSVFGEAHLRYGLHHDNSAVDYLDQNYVASIGWEQARFGLRLPVEYSHAHQDGESQLSRWSLTPGAFIRFNDDALLYGFLRLDDNDFASSANPAEDRSGTSRSLGLQGQFRFAGGRGDIRAIAEFGEDDTEGDNWQRERWRLYLQSRYQLTERWRLGLGAEYLNDDYDNLHNVFLTRREDRITTLFATANYAVTQDWEAFLQASHIRSDSTLEPYDYRRTIFAVGLQWQF